MFYTFAWCDNLSNDINIESEIITNASNCFEGTSLEKNVYIPFTYANGVNTLTYNAFKDAGYSNDTRKDGVLLIDINYDPELFNWRYRTLSNGVRLLQEYLGSETNISVPNRKTIIREGFGSPFYNNHQFVSVDLNKTNIENDYMGVLFDSCTNLVNVTKIPDSVITMTSTFYSCSNLVNAPVIPNSVVYMSGTFYNCINLVNAPVIPNSVIDMSQTFIVCYNLVNAPVIPNSVINMAETFQYCNNLVNAPVIPNSVINMSQTFYYCYNLSGNIYIYSEQVSNIQDCFFYSSLDKDVYIPFTYANGEFTTTYNTFTQYYSPTNRRSGVLLFDINSL